MKAHITYNAHSHIFEIPDLATIAMLKDIIHKNLDLPPSNQKLVYKGKQLPADAQVPESGKIMLLASSTTSIDAIKSQSEALRLSAQRRAAAAPSSSSKHTKLNVSKSAQDANTSRFKFHHISALHSLPDPAKSQAFLVRLSCDPTIRALMTRHALSVGHLTELDPRHFTTHDAKTLGLNKNAGQEILLRLRTDELDGWRDYKTVRVTLVHELVHNTFGDHDDKFWGLFRGYMKELEGSEAGERKLNHGGVYIPPEVAQSDHGGVRGSETRTMGVGGAEKVEGSAGSVGSRAASVGAREMRARAAEERSQGHHHHQEGEAGGGGAQA